MKHSFIIVLSLVSLLALPACHKPSQNEGTGSDKQEKVQEAEQPAAQAAEDAKPAEEPAADSKPADDKNEQEVADNTGFVKTSGDWSDMKLNILNYPESSDEKDKVAIKKDISELLQKWNNLRNLKDSDKLSKLYDGNLYLRGSLIENKNIAAKFKKSFEKHKDYSQTPGIRVTATYLSTSATESAETWSVQFDETFTQDGKTTDTEILLILSRKLLDDAQSSWSIIVESDIATDRNLLKKIGLASEEPKDCEGMAYRILTESPIIRYFANTMYEDVLADEKSGDLEGVYLSEEPGEEATSVDAKQFTYRLYEDHAGDSEDSEDSGHRATISIFSIDLEANTIEDDIEEIVYPIDTRYAADIKRVCK